MSPALRSLLGFACSALVVACGSGEGTSSGSGATTSSGNGGATTTGSTATTSTGSSTTSSTGTGGSGGATTTTTSGTGGSGGDPTAIVPAVTSCPTPASACTGSNPISGARASYRKDHYYPDSVYNEYTDAPVSGGRFHIALIAQVTGDVTTVDIDGFDTSQIGTANKPPVEWYHVYPRHLVAGKPFFVQFHSRDAKWDGKTTGTLKVQTSAGPAFDGTFTFAETPVPLTYVTTSSDYKTLLLHVKNTDTTAHHVQTIFVDGKDATPPPACRAPRSPRAPRRSTRSISASPNRPARRSPS